jgi:hypothetical protein
MTSGSDEPRVPSQRTEESQRTEDQTQDRTDDERSWDADQHSPGGSPGGPPRDEAAHDDETRYEAAREAEARGTDFPPGGQTTTPVPSPSDQRVYEDERVYGADNDSDAEVSARSPRAGDEYADAVPGAVATPAPVDQETPYRDPYVRTAGDMAAEPEPDPVHAPDPVHTSGMADERPGHAVPDDVVLFDQDPARVQDRWRDVQASFVDDPGEAVQRADALLGEVVESLTSSLTSRTDALRDRWKDAGAPDTEQLRLALRDYRNVLERLLALSGHRSEGTR